MLWLGGISILEVTLKPFYGVRHWLLLCLLDLGIESLVFWEGLLSLLGAAGRVCSLCWGLLGAAGSCREQEQSPHHSQHDAVHLGMGSGCYRRGQVLCASKPSNILKSWMAMPGRYHRG